MGHLRRGAALLLCAAATVAAAGLTQPAQGDPAVDENGEVVVAWNAIAQRTLFSDNATPIPSGQVILGAVSLAVHDAVDESLRESRRGEVSASAAAAVAAHDVLLHYFGAVPATVTKLDADLATTLAGISAGDARDAGVDNGEEAAADLVATRDGDGWGDATIGYSRPAGIGVWQPAPGTGMAVPWLGFVRPLVLDSPTRIHPNGPDPVTSKRYAQDLAEVMAYGEDDSSVRTTPQTATALFFNANVVAQMQAAMRSMAAGADVRSAARLFGLANVAAADAIITTWRQKLDVGFWRPSQAISAADVDGNPDTATPTTPWAPLVGNPPYPDYPSGHATLMGAYTEAFRLLGHSDQIHAVVPSLVAGVPDRTYLSADVLEEDAFNARIWLGIHFRDAMQDANFIGEQAAHLVRHRFENGG
ncbi:MAG: vanadium-dependent haloperoxidase [Nocardioides sp.]